LWSAKSIYFGDVKTSLQLDEGILMSLKDLVGLIMIIVGAILFLYGSNSYNSLFGWGGIYVLAAGIVTEIVLEVYKSIRKKES
jgi:hypothetical protein